MGFGCWDVEAEVKGGRHPSIDDDGGDVDDENGLQLLIMCVMVPFQDLAVA